MKNDVLNIRHDIHSIKEPRVASHFNDGIVSPDIAGVLDTLRNSEFLDFKLSGSNAYYYLIDSHNRTIHTDIYNNILYIEVDRKRLGHIISSAQCPAIKGPKGLRGRDGINGLPGPKECAFSTKLNGAILELEAPLYTPLDTPISLRLINSDKIIDIRYKDDKWWIYRNTSGLTILDVHISIKDNVVNAYIESDSSWEGEWKAKVRQIGPKGIDGNDGSPFLRVRNISIDSTSNSVIINLRSSSDDLFKLTRRIPDDLVVSRLRPDPSAEFNDLDALNKHKYVAVVPSLDHNKPLAIFSMAREGPRKGDLFLPVWHPDPSCLHINDDPIVPSGARMPWWDDVDTTKCGMAGVPIYEEPFMPKKCCQEDFFFCPIGIRPAAEPEIEEPSSSSSHFSSSSSSGSGKKSSSSSSHHSSSSKLSSSSSHFSSSSRFSSSSKLSSSSSSDSSFSSSSSLSSSSSSSSSFSSSSSSFSSSSSLADDSAPCDCPEGLADCYRIANYSDGDIPAGDCEECTDDEENIPWDGVFESDQADCVWVNAGEDVNSIDGKEMISARLELFVNEDCYWRLFIECLDEADPFDFPIIWEGIKFDGQTPEGVYNRTGGCAPGPENLVIEDCSGDGNECDSCPDNPPQFMTLEVIEPIKLSQDCLVNGFHPMVINDDELPAGTKILLEQSGDDPCRYDAVEGHDHGVSYTVYEGDEDCEGDGAEGEGKEILAQLFIESVDDKPQYTISFIELDMSPANGEAIIFMSFGGPTVNYCVQSADLPSDFGEGDLDDPEPVGYNGKVRVLPGNHI